MEVETSVEDKFQSLFGSSVSGTGEEELLRLASSFSRQYSAKQIKIILWLELKAHEFEETGRTIGARAIRSFIERYENLKQYNNSDIFVMKALDSISLRKFINENTLRINLDKK